MRGDEAGLETVPWAAWLPMPRALDQSRRVCRHLQNRVHSRGAASREQGEIMLKARRDAAMKVADSLFAVEKAIDEALARAAEFHGTLISARAEANVSALVAHDAFEVAASAFASLARARCDIVETHNRLSEAKIQIGLRTVSIGDLGPKPQVKGFDGASHLTAVA